MTHKTEFPKAFHVDDEILAALEGTYRLEDNSWHNNTAPSWTGEDPRSDDDEDFIEVFVHPINPADREIPTMPRFVVVDALGEVMHEGMQLNALELFLNDMTHFPADYV